MDRPVPTKITANILVNLNLRINLVELEAPFKK